MFNIVKRYFEKGLYSADDVRKFVNCGKLSAEEYNEITGREFD